MHRIARPLCLFALALVAVAGLATAGPLDPPAGPVAPTMKPLSDVEPRIAVNAVNTPGQPNGMYVLGAPGSYYLTGNIVANIKTPIVFASDHVTLDLNGFTLSWTGSALGSAAGVWTSGHDYVVVKNGIITDFPGNGLQGSGSHDARFENVTVVRSGSIGISIDSDSIVDHCIVAGAGGIGIYSMAGDNTFTYCRVSGATDDGFRLAQGDSADHCKADNGVADGFESAGRTLITGCQARANGFVGFRANGTGTIRGCIASQNQAGIRSETGTGLLIQDNECSDNTGFGIWMNGAVGCRIDGNQLYSNGGNGMYLNANGAHLVVRNTARNNGGGNYTWDGNSDYGMVLTNPGPNFASSNPWANFSY